MVRPRLVLGPPLTPTRPQLAFLVRAPSIPALPLTDPSFQAIPAGSSVPIGVIVCKQSMHKHAANRGYIAMLSVNKSWRKRGVGERVPPFPSHV